MARQGESHRDQTEQLKGALANLYEKYRRLKHDVRDQHHARGATAKDAQAPDTGSSSIRLDLQLATRRAQDAEERVAALRREVEEERRTSEATQRALMEARLRVRRKLLAGSPPIGMHPHQWALALPPAAARRSSSRTCAGMLPSLRLPGSRPRSPSSRRVRGQSAHSMLLASFNSAARVQADKTGLKGSLLAQSQQHAEALLLQRRRNSGGGGASTRETRHSSAPPWSTQDDGSDGDGLSVAPRGRDSGYGRRAASTSGPRRSSLRAPQAASAEAYEEVRGALLSDADLRPRRSSADAAAMQAAAAEVAALLRRVAALEADVASARAATQSAQADVATAQAERDALQGAVRAERDAAARAASGQMADLRQQLTRAGERLEASARHAADLEDAVQRAEAAATAAGGAVAVEQQRTRAAHMAAHVAALRLDAVLPPPDKEGAAAASDASAHSATAAAPRPRKGSGAAGAAAVDAETWEPLLRRVADMSSALAEAQGTIVSLRERLAAAALHRQRLEAGSLALQVELEQAAVSVQVGFDAVWRGGWGAEAGRSERAGGGGAARDSVLSHGVCDRRPPPPRSLSRGPSPSRCRSSRGAGGQRWTPRPPLRGATCSPTR